ncbi:MAG: hypothetical protein CVU12_05725 [Bacteroidetes bacterium HGW-Bacteroidetes-7]|jgi:hypothetical protein|nr:MAG: hypothetical protein CVU12_05725 [Bacteroidetes bacterium HGW-Bacteroidetes-7]
MEEPINNTSVILITKSGGTIGSVVDGGSGGGGQGSASGNFTYPTGWCLFNSGDFECKVDWVNGVPSVSTFTLFNIFPSMQELKVDSKNAYFSIPEEEISVNITYTIKPIKRKDSTFTFPPYQGVFAFKINIPNARVITPGSLNYPPIPTIHRSYNVVSLDRYYNISFITDTTDNSIIASNVNLMSHSFEDEPSISYTYNISADQVTFEIAGIVIVPFLLPNGSIRLTDLIFDDSFTVQL